MTEGAPAPAGRRWLFIALAATLLSLGVAAVTKAPCLSHSWDGFQYTNRCYSDPVPLYGARHLDGDAVPYLDFVPPGPGERLEDAVGFNEYPTLTGLVQYATSRPVSDAAGFFWATALVMAACAVATTLLLGRAGVQPFWLVGSALAPPLALYAFNNWDLLAVALATGGLVAYRKERPGLTGALLALGASAKIYPALLLALVGCDLLRRESGLGRAGWRFGLAAVGTLALVQGPFILLNFEGWWATYQFHLGRSPTFEAPWTVLAHLAEGSPELSRFFGETLPDAASLMLLLAVALLCIAVERGRLKLAHACLAAVTLFLLLNTVQSLQYALWLIPLVALAELDPRWVFPYLAADFLVFWTIWPFLHGLEHGIDLWAALTVAVLFRAAAQGLLAVGAVRAGWQPRPAARIRQEPLL
ncbi:MAG: glycosyltransferase 87 family protein [Candidatus Thermoplasmatota archaeon]